MGILVRDVRRERRGYSSTGKAVIGAAFPLRVTVAQAEVTGAEAQMSRRPGRGWVRGMCCGRLLQSWR